MSALVRSPRNNVCHLVEDGERRTACGLMRVNDAHLRLFAVEEIPPRHTLCKHCERACGALPRLTLTCAPRTRDTSNRGTHDNQDLR